MAWGRCKGNGLQSGQYLLDAKEIADINTAGGVFCDHSQLITSSAVVAYRLPSGTIVSGQMLYGSGLRTAANDAAFTNSSHFQSWTTYSTSITHTFTLPWEQQKMLVGFEVINLPGGPTRRYFGTGLIRSSSPRMPFSSRKVFSTASV